jgi:hypothetical protein
MKELGWYGVAVFVLGLALGIAINFGLSFAVTWLVCEVAGITFKWAIVWLVFLILWILGAIFKKR